MKNIIFYLFALLPQVLNAQLPSLVAQPYLTGFVKPVVMTHCGDDRLFIVEQDGRIRIVLNDTVMVTPFLDINPQVISVGQEQGLLGLAFHPDYKQNGFFYVNYTNNSGHTTISRFSVDPADSNHALVNSQLILMVINQPYTNHNGGCLAFDKDGYLYIAMGDGGSANDPQNRAQNKKQRLGKILRIDVNHGVLYSIPPDNPFVNDTAFLPEIWNIGTRNPWRVSFDRVTDDFWIGDVGQNLWEEVDFQAADSPGGENYGWRCYEATHVFDTAGCQPVNAFTDPVHEYAHSGLNCSVTGGEVYRGSRYANLFGMYVFSDFCLPTFRTIKKTGNQFVYASNNLWQGAGISSFGSDLAGQLYVSNLYNGEVRKIVDTSSCVPVAWLSDSDTLRICDSSGNLWTPNDDSVLYVWYQNGTLLSGSTSNVLPVVQNGTYVVSVYSLRTGCLNADTVYVELLGAPPVASISGLNSLYCVYDNPVMLSGNPLGGVFNGLGISGSTFSPAMADTGTILIQYKYTDANGCISKALLSTEVDACVGVDDMVEIRSMSVYPNPAMDEIVVAFTSLEKSESVISVYDMLGKEWVSDHTVLSAGRNTKLLNISLLQPGVYFVAITKEAGTTGGRLFVKY